MPGSANASTMQTSSAPRGISARMSGGGMLHREDDAGVGQGGGRIGGDLGAGGGEVGVRDRRGCAGAGFDHDSQAEPDEPLDCFRGGGHARLGRAAFLQHRKAHPLDPLIHWPCGPQVTGRGTMREHKRRCKQARHGRQSGEVKASRGAAPNPAKGAAPEPRQRLCLCDPSVGLGVAWAPAVLLVRSDRRPSHTQPK